MANIGIERSETEIFPAMRFTLIIYRSFDVDDRGWIGENGRIGEKVKVLV